MHGCDRQCCRLRDPVQGFVHSRKTFPLMESLDFLWAVYVTLQAVLEAVYLKAVRLLLRLRTLLLRLRTLLEATYFS